MRKAFSTIYLGLGAAALALAAPGAGATVVEFQTVLGNFEVNLFDENAPATVANFLGYVNNGAYTDSIVHRSAAGFVIQGGGFTYGGTLAFAAIDANDPVVNEPVLSNRRGTIAMAKFAGNPDSATTQWFINLADNQDNLDSQSGGFSVFGVVMGDGMDIVDAIAELPILNLGGSFTRLPLRDYTDTSMDPDEDNIVIVSQIVVTDSSTVTNPDLLPPPNTTAQPRSDGGGGGGAPAPWTLLLCLALMRRPRSG